MLTPLNQNRQFSDLLKVLIDQGYEGIVEVFQTLLNEAAKIERSESLRAAPYERAEERTGYANGLHLVRQFQIRREPNLCHSASIQ